MMKKNETSQKDLFNTIAQQYAAHYNDRYSRAYRDRFINHPMFEGIRLRGMKVLDAMCGNGAATDYLLEKGADVIGLDLSFAMLTSYTAVQNSRAINASALYSGLKDCSFDCVVVQGGLHHIHPDESRAIDEVYRVLKPGGLFCFSEPHRNSLPDMIRTFWYRNDSLFESNEAAVDIRELMNNNKHRFACSRCVYNGTIAYFFVYNSMILRIPLKAKRLYAPFLLALERVLTPLNNRFSTCFAVCRWEKLP